MVHWEWTFCPLGVYFLLFNPMKILSCSKLKVHYKMDFNHQILESFSPLGVDFQSTTLWNYQGTGQYFLTKISTLKPLTIPVFSVAFVVPTEQLPIGAIRCHFSLYRKKRYALFLIGSGTGGEGAHWRPSPPRKVALLPSSPPYPAQPLEQLLLAYCGISVKGQNR